MTDEDIKWLDSLHEYQWACHLGELEDEFSNALLKRFGDELQDKAMDRHLTLGEVVLEDSPETAVKLAKELVNINPETLREIYPRFKVEITEIEDTL